MALESNGIIMQDYLTEIRSSEYWSTRVEAGSNTSTVTLRVVGGDEKGSLRWRGPAAYTKDRPVLSSERAPHKNKTVTVKQ
jgi:hypothetical protein